MTGTGSSCHCCSLAVSVQGFTGASKIGGSCFGVLNQESYSFRSILGGRDFWEQPCGLRVVVVHPFGLPLHGQKRCV